VPRAPSPAADFPSLLEAARRGCQESLGRLLQQCRPYLLPAASRRLGGDLRTRLSASDLVQETFLRAADRFASFRGQSEAELRAWLRRLLLNRLADEAARQRRRPAVPLAGRDPEADAGPPSAALIRREVSEAMDRELAQLPAARREVVLLCHRGDLTWAQIGARVGRSAAAARVLYGRAVKQLARALRPAYEFC